MTHEQKLQELTADIREKLPRLMELKKGCEIIRGTGMNRELCIYLGQDHILRKHHLFGSLSFTFSTYDLGDYKIKGAEPMLNDVLEWCHKFTGGIIKGIYRNYNFTISSKGEFRCGNFHDGFIGYWDLSKPYLRDQSEELIDFLHNLIKK